MSAATIRAAVSEKHEGHGLDLKVRTLGLVNSVPLLRASEAKLHITT